MASMNTAAMDTVNLLPTAIMVVIGSLTATIVTEVARENVYDVQMEGGDAVYPFAGAFLLLMLLDGRSVQMVSVGMLASGVTTIARQWGLV